MFTVENDVLHVAGVDIRAALADYGDPLYVYDGEVIEAQYRKLRAALPKRVRIIYSVKANPNIGVVAFLAQLVDGLDVSSAGEILAADAAGVASKRLYFVGPSKSEAELRLAVDRGIGCVIIESEAELRRLAPYAASASRPVRIALRINPAGDHGGAKLSMGGTARQFGIDEEAAPAVVRAAAALPGIELAGIHVYVGTRILDPSVVARNTREALRIAAALQEVAGTPFSIVDVGGGIGVPYSGSEREFDIAAFADLVAPVIEDGARALPSATFVLESGRYLVADAGVYATRVREVKYSRGHKHLLVAGGMNHHFATTSGGSLMKSHFPIEVATRMTAEKTTDSTVCGPLCTPSDVLGRNVKLADAAAGDVLCVMKSGAYGVSASPTGFLSHPRPAEVLAYAGRTYLVREADEPGDVLRRQRLAPISPAASVRTDIHAAVHH